MGRKKNRKKKTDFNKLFLIRSFFSFLNKNFNSIEKKLEIQKKIKQSKINWIVLFKNLILKISLIYFYFKFKYFETICSAIIEN